MVNCISSQAVFKISGCPVVLTTKKVAGQPHLSLLLSVGQQKKEKKKKKKSFLGGFEPGSLGNAESITEWFKNISFLYPKRSKL